MPWFAAVDALLEAKRPRGVVIATPNATHADLTVRCLERGSAVLVEKPIADTVDAIASRGFKAALTTEIALSDAPAAQRFALPRLDTNHLPKDASAVPNEWTLAASA